MEQKYRTNPGSPNLNSTARNSIGGSPFRTDPERGAPKLGTVIADLQENSKGEWDRNIAERKVDDFLRMDIYSTPSL